MKRFGKGIAILAIALVVVACSSQRVLMPPRVDLHAFGTIGILEFTPNTFDGLNQQATREFLSAIHAAQPGVPVVELGNQDIVLRGLGRYVLDPDAIRAIGKKHRVDAVAVGVLESRRIEPSIALGRSAESLSASAALEGALTVRIVDTRSGATVWSSSVRGREPLAGVRLAGGDLTGIAASDPNGAAINLVGHMVDAATSDFWAYWVRQ